MQVKKEEPKNFLPLNELLSELRSNNINFRYEFTEVNPNNTIGHDFYKCRNKKHIIILTFKRSINKVNIYYFKNPNEPIYILKDENIIFCCKKIKILLPLFEKM